MAKMVLGVFKNRNQADNALAHLNSLGYDPEQISVITREEQKTAAGTREDTSAADNVVAGATTGGAIGAVAGLLVGIGAIAVPGIGALFIAGPLAAALGLTGAAATTVSGAVTGALAGGLVGALTRIGVPEEEAREYERQIQSGAVLLAVPVMDDMNVEPSRIMEDAGAEQVRVLDINPIR